MHFFFEQGSGNMKWLIFGAFLVMTIIPFSAASSGEDKYGCLLENEYIARTIVHDSYGVRTISLTNKLTGKKYDLTSAGFFLRLDGGGVELRSSDFEVLATLPY